MSLAPNIKQGPRQNLLYTVLTNDKWSIVTVHSQLVQHSGAKSTVHRDMFWLGSTWQAYYIDSYSALINTYGAAKSTVHRDMFWLGSRQIKSSMVQAAHSLQCNSLPHCTAQCTMHNALHNAILCQRLDFNELRLCSALCAVCTLLNWSEGK